VTLQTFEELEILEGVRKLTRKVDHLERLIHEILHDVKPKPVTYRPTSRISVTPRTIIPVRR
jgi:hypothetical protein